MIHIVIADALSLSRDALTALLTNEPDFDVIGEAGDTDSLLRIAIAAAPDVLLLDTALVPHGRTLFEKEFMAASLDHALWFHRPFRADEWLLYAQETPNLNGARGFARGLIYAADGTLVASVAQEGLVRLRRAEA